MRMSSSEPVFSNQGNPFPSPVRDRTHYRPSKVKALSEDQKHTVLSPSRLCSLCDALSPPDHSFLGGTQRLGSGAPESDSSGPFDESWPSTEGSSSKTPERDERQTGPVPYGTDPSSQDSVIARYLERFRSGRPTSRLERSPPSLGMKDFWWLQTSPDSPDEVRKHSVTGATASSRFSLHNLEMSPPHQDVSLSESKLYSDQVDILSLQEKAGKLIVRSESSLSSAGAVSSEGIGSSPSSNMSSSGSDQYKTRVSVPAQPVPSTERRVPALAPSALGRFAALAPEEDILYQWRLRRKMEQAREGTLAPPTQRRTTSPPVRIPRQVISERLFSPSPSPQPKAGKKKEKQAPPLSPPSNQLQPLEIAAQLLEDAEDSDGTEFEDDPLLHVLREQREALRRRLRAVDERLSELEAEDRADPSPLP
uniref:Proline and serine rich 3 n=1 Tax=Xenopus tropicalis TaxID=8364 RepID=A0A803K3L8_XENTR